MSLDKVTPGSKLPETFNVVIEIPADAAPVKYEVDKPTGYLKVDRPQQTSSSPPTLYGFIPRTYAGERVKELCPGAVAGDGDPMDVCVISERPIERADFIDICRVVEKLDMIRATVGTSLADYPPCSRDFVGTRLMAQYTTKHMRPCIYTPTGTIAMREMAQAILGSRAPAECPIVSFGFTAVSPLRWSEVGLESFRLSSGHGIPMMVNSEPVSGATGPVTPAGALTIANAEALAGTVIVQLLEPGRPTIFNLGFAHTLDMRTTVTRTGSPECALIQSAGAQLARFHGMPSAAWSRSARMSRMGMMPVSTV